MSVPPVFAPAQLLRSPCPVSDWVGLVVLAMSIWVRTHRIRCVQPSQSAPPAPGTLASSKFSVNAYWFDPAAMVATEVVRASANWYRARSGAPVRVYWNTSVPLAPVVPHCVGMLQVGAVVPRASVGAND